MGLVFLFFTALFCTLLYPGLFFFFLSLASITTKLSPFDQSGVQ